MAISEKPCNLEIQKFWTNGTIFWSLNTKGELLAGRLLCMKIPKKRKTSILPFKDDETLFVFFYKPLTFSAHILLSLYPLYIAVYLHSYLSMSIITTIPHSPISHYVYMPLCPYITVCTHMWDFPMSICIFALLSLCLYVSEFLYPLNLCSFVFDNCVLLSDCPQPGGRWSKSLKFALRNIWTAPNLLK